MANEHLYQDFQSPNIADYDTDAINNAIVNIIRTPVGSLVGMPEFGSRLNEITFNHIDHITISLIKRLIGEALYKWENRIIVMSVDVKTIPEYNRLIAILRYKFKDDQLNKVNTLTVNLTNR